MIPLEIAIMFLVTLLCALILLAWPDDMPGRPERKPPVGGTGTVKPIEKSNMSVDNELLDMTVFGVSMTSQGERIEKLEREVAELRGMVTVLMGRTVTMPPLGGGIPPHPLTVGPIFKRPIPPMCDEGGWNNVPGTCGPIMPIHYPEEPPSWDITTMLEEGRKQILTPEGERLVREAKQQDLPTCHL